MIENSVQLQKKPSIFSNLTERGRQQIKEYHDTLVYQGAVAELNKALGLFIEGIQNLTSSESPLILTDRSEDKPHQSIKGSWRQHTLVAAKRDGLGILTLSGDVKYDSIEGYSAYNRYKGQHLEWYTTVRHQTVFIQVHKDGAIANVWSDKVVDTRADYISDIWSNDKYRTDPKLVDDRGDQAKAIEFLARQIAS